MHWCLPMRHFFFGRHSANLLFVSIGTCQTWGMFESKPKTKPAISACPCGWVIAEMLWQRWKSPCVSNMVVVWQCDPHKLVGFFPLSLEYPPFPPISFRSRCCCSAQKLISQPSMFETAAITHILTENIFQRGELWHWIIEFDFLQSVLRWPLWMEIWKTLINQHDTKDKQLEFVILGKHTLQPATILRSLRFLFNLTPVGWKTLCVGPSMLQVIKIKPPPCLRAVQPF